ncbi:cytochrome P450 4C1-like [Ochlerotatus camptorhynchus]|uniref:cytochrome P450 4C1-like n=1 Tax=Ochlerotatus camptorhynchus TaxID=644619 RepID=UPI0031D1BF6E
MLNITVLLALLAIGLIRLFVRRRNLQQFANHFPGPKPVFAIGNVLKFPKDIGGIFRRMLRFHYEYGPDIVTWGIGNDVMLNLSSTKNVEKVLNTKIIQKSTMYSFIEPWLGKGLLTSSGKKWFHRRKIITPTFHFKILEGFVEVFNRGVDVLVEKLKVHDGGGEFDIYDYISLYTLDSICETAMGVQVNAQNDPENQYVRDVNRMTELILLRIFSLLRTFPTLYWYLHPNAWEQRHLVRRLHQFTDSVIWNRRQQLVNGNEKRSIENDTTTKKKQTFLDLLLSMTVEGKPLSNEDIREEVDTFMFGGHDTTSSAISFTILQLAKHQDIQEKLYQEIESILKHQNCGTGRTLAYSNIQDFKYLDLVVKESLRLLPPISYVGRKLTEDTEINGAVVPAGQDVSIPIYMVHRNPKVYPDPERFNPERFAEDSENMRGPYDYIPFSIGSRNCIGQKYGLMQLKMTVARLIVNFRVLPGESTWDVKLRTDLVLRPERGIPIRIESRN